MCVYCAYEHLKYILVLDQYCIKHLASNVMHREI